MFLARVQGHVVASQKDESLARQRLMVVEPLKVAYAEGQRSQFEATGRALVAVDRIGAGEGQLVLIAQGSSARLTSGCEKMPVDAVIVGLVDSAEIGGQSMDLERLAGT